MRLRTPPSKLMILDGFSARLSSIDNSKSPLSQLGHSGEINGDNSQARQQVAGPDSAGWPSAVFKIVHCPKGRSGMGQANRGSSRQGGITG
jgi:hypothetical protein